MSKLLKITFIAILLLSCYHTVRDILQTFEIHNWFTEIFHRPHLWCRPYCNIATIPLDLFGIIAPVVVLKRNRLGIIGVIVLLSMFLWPLAIFLP